MAVAVVVQNKTKSLFFLYANFLLSVVVNRNNFSGGIAYQVHTWGLKHSPPKHPKVCKSATCFSKCSFE